MAGFNGGFINGDFSPTKSQKQPGVWSLQEVYKGRTTQKWPDTTVVSIATGGQEIYNIQVGGQLYAVHQFMTVGTSSFVLPSTKTVEYLIVGGGGAGGGTPADAAGGGGGAGGFLTGTFTNLAAATYSIVVGAGGIPGTNFGGDGGSSSFNAVTAIGGGGGGGATSRNGRSGGSGGGPAAGISGTPTVGAGTAGQGFSSGTAGTSSATAVIGAGGGGGAGGVGGNGFVDIYTQASYRNGGVGGIGLTSAITGTTLYYAGGGGGGYLTYGDEGYFDSAGDPNFLLTGGVGGVGGGGTAAVRYPIYAPRHREATPGAPNTGGGGGGGGAGGGSGIVIIRYAVP